jgi:signal transduction histidine kinase/ActR/RegA family two-component response regulator
VQLLFERTRISGWTNFVGALFLAALLWGQQPTAVLLSWVGVKAALLALRCLVRTRYEDRRGWSDARWRCIYSSTIVADGLAWGIAGVLFATPLVQLSDVLILGSLVAVVAVAGLVHALHPPLQLGFSAAVLLPPAIAQLLAGGNYGVFVFVGLLLFEAIMVMEARTAARQLNELLRLRMGLEAEAGARAEALALAEQLSAAKSQFLATMSHEMRTPLHGILGLARRWRTAAPGQSPERAADLIERSGEHLLGLINDVLDFAKIDAGHLRLVEAPFDMGALIEEVVAVTGEAARTKGLTLDVDTTGLLPAGGWMSGDAARVRQVLHNLLSNAVKFTDHGRIGVRAWRDAGNGRACIEVEDSGIGIPAEQMDQVFEAFQQADNAFDRRFGGTGLGLSVARELARAMGGELSVRSQPGGGSVFRFEAPLPPAQPDTQAPEQAPPPGAAMALSGRVLVAEDNGVSALVVEAMLERFGVEVEVVGDGAQAVDRWERSQPDLVLMDCQMPELDGFAATRVIREREALTGRRPVPIVALTANAFESDRERCFAAGMDEHLAKPFREEELVEVLKRHLGRSQPAQDQAALMV